MTQPSTKRYGAPRKTALHAEHLRLGARMVDFGGWEMPIQYTGVIDEHLATRQAAGLFDVSHMGEIEVEGRDAGRFLNYLVTNNVAALAVGQAQYTVMCHAHGGIVDDLVIYRRAPISAPAGERYLVVVNASNTEKDFAHFEKILGEFLQLPNAAPGGGSPDVRITNASNRYSQIAIQGPKAAEILQKLTDTALAPIKTYWFAEGAVKLGDSSVPAILARTGYTGEDGFEIYVAWDEGPALWRALLSAGETDGLKPVGLGARDTLRLEMKYPLYGQELTDQTHPLEAGLGWVVKLAQGVKGDFVGRTALESAKAQGLGRKLVGLKLTVPGIARHGYRVLDASGVAIGEVTSGSQSPCTKEAIAIAYVAAEHAQIGTTVQVEIRGKGALAVVCETPFYKKGS